MDDKFVLMNMDDKRSKKIAEAISNPTCKKIIDYLTSNSEKSEDDIAKALGINLNTTEYNLKKLLEAGLIEKTKNFFWSKKGKKISLYKLANKHIVISPKSFKPSAEMLKSIIPVALISGLFALIIRTFFTTKQAVDLSQEAGADAFAATASKVDTTQIAIESTHSLANNSPWTWFIIGALLGVGIFIFYRVIRRSK